MDELQLDGVAYVPQLAGVKSFLTAAWANPDVLAIWIGGSIASGTADAYSDVDLRLAVRQLDPWRMLDLPTLFHGGAVASGLVYGGETVLHQVVLSGGGIVDLWVQEPRHTPPSEAVLLLGCRDAAVRKLLEEVRPHAAFQEEPAQADAVVRLLTDFWINSLKHQKVLHRGLEPLVIWGLHAERTALLRLEHIRVTGLDTGPHSYTIHTLTRFIQPVEDRAALLGLLGAPLTTRGQIVRAIERHRDEVARLGRGLAAALSFDYPAELEATVRESWDRFRAADH